MLCFTTNLKLICFLDDHFRVLLQAPAIEALTALPAGCLAELSDTTIAKIEELFQGMSWSRSNPVFFPYDSGM